MVLVVVLVLSAVAIAFHEGWLRAPWADRHAELSAQLRDRATVAVAGAVPWGLARSDTPLVSVGREPALAAALSGRDTARVASESRRLHLDGVLVRTDLGLGAPGTALRALASMEPAVGLGAVYLDETAALYETRDDVSVSADDARRLVTTARLILGGAVAPPDRIFPEALRRTRPVELAIMVREGHGAILWRSTRGGSIARAFLSVCYAIMDRWTSRETETYGRLRDALQTRLSLTIAVFYDKGVLGARSPEFLRRVANPRAWAVGYERLASWEYGLPPSPWAPALDPAEQLRTLARDHGITAPGYLRPELTVYRFRAFQMIEATPNGPITLFDP